MSTKRLKIVFIGAGNVATHLSKALQKAGHHILQIYSRTEKSAKELAMQLNVPYTFNLSDLNREADLYVISVSDKAIEPLLAQKDFGKKLVIHTSGSISMDVFKGHATNYGVFYPLQTFSKFKEIDLKKVPVCIEANTRENEEILLAVARELSDNVQLVDSQQREIIHVAAVFACNFSNQMYAIADKLLKEHGLPFNILLPLIDETAEKIKITSPLEAQTGPAVRDDQNVIDNHLKLLTNFPEFQKIYSFVTESIQSLQETKKK
ncbi:MAG: F420-dependent NADP oxidoreductase [Bacteroidota bacterium]|nr:F420-dependent NADP oxidoreductase [Bacteroidota bacterium]